MDSHPAFLEALPRYRNKLDKAFTKAKQQCELEFLFCLFRVRGAMDAGWDPFETTLQAIPSVIDLENKAEDWQARRHLQLWIYGHILEASEPYELLANLLAVAGGSHYSWSTNFPAPQRSPGSKIDRIEQIAKKAMLPDTICPLKEIWDRNLRNAIFHSDYTLIGEQVRIMEPPRSYPNEEIMQLVNRAIAYHGAWVALLQYHIESYKKPVEIPTSPHFRGDPELRWVVIVRKGYGAAGVKDAWSKEQLKAGKIPVRVGRFYDEERNLLNQDSTIAELPERHAAFGVQFRPR